MQPSMMPVDVGCTRGVGVWCVMYVFIRVCRVEDGDGGGGQLG